MILSCPTQEQPSHWKQARVPQNLREEKPLLKGKRDPGMRKSRKKRAGLRWGLRRKGQSQEWVQEGGSIQEEGLGKWVLIRKPIILTSTPSASPVGQADSSHPLAGLIKSLRQGKVRIKLVLAWKRQTDLRTDDRV